MNEKQIIELLDDYGWHDVARFLKWRLSPEGSSPASCSESRGAATGHYAHNKITPQLRHSEAKDGVELVRVVESLMWRAAKFRFRDREGKPDKSVTNQDIDEMMAAELDRAATKLKSAILSDPLTQSVVGAVEECPECRSIESEIIGLDETIQCSSCLHIWARGRLRERNEPRNVPIHLPETNQDHE